MTDQLKNEGYDTRKRFVSKRDGEIYYLKLVRRPGVDGTEHDVYQLKNRVHFWEGDEAQFKASFGQ